MDHRSPLACSCWRCHSTQPTAYSGFGRNVVCPVPSQGVIVDVKFTSGSLDRGTRRKETLNPHAFGVITALASPRARPLSSRHLYPHEYTLNQNPNIQRTNADLNGGILSQNFGVIMAEIKPPGRRGQTRSAPGFFTTIVDQNHRSQTQRG